MLIHNYIAIIAIACNDQLVYNIIMIMPRQVLADGDYSYISAR